MGMFIWSMGSPDCKDIKIAKSIFAVHDSPPFFVVLGAWITWAEMKKKPLGMG